jgi:PEP-CTERM motif
MKLSSTFLASILALGTASTANATIVLTPGSGWHEFKFGDVGDAFADDFEFTLTSSSVFKITDAYFDGDQFALSGDGGATYADTSTPVNDGTYVGTDWDAAFASPKFSSFSILLGPGSYDVIGKVLASPYGSGGAAVELAGAPEPAAWALMILGFGVIGGALRRQIRSSEVKYAMA